MRLLPRTLNLIRAIEDDLEIKVDFCRALGLSTNALVIASTKQDGLKEVKGLEVWYIEKFLAADAEAAPHRFSSFSSPATEQVAPGRYVFWSRSPPERRTGEKVEQCLCLARAAAPSRAGPDIQNRPACPVRNLRNWLLAGVFAFVVAGSVAVAPGNPWFQAFFTAVVTAIAIAVSCKPGAMSPRWRIAASIAASARQPRLCMLPMTPSSARAPRTMHPAGGW